MREKELEDGSRVPVPGVSRRVVARVERSCVSDVVGMHPLRSRLNRSALVPCPPRLSVVSRATVDGLSVYQVAPHWFALALWSLSSGCQCPRQPTWQKQCRGVTDTVRYSVSSSFTETVPETVRVTNVTRSHIKPSCPIAPKVLAQAAAASAAGRNWSVYGQIQTAQKARMRHKTADKLVYCHEAMHLQLRMQDAGWAADVERWESDSDSDASADEAEADETAGTLSEAQLLRLMA